MRRRGASRRHTPRRTREQRPKKSVSEVASRLLRRAIKPAESSRQGGLSAWHRATGCDLELAKANLGGPPW